jgi:hypothetical protein
MAIVRLEGLGQLNKSNDLIGNRTRDLPTLSVNQTIALDDKLINNGGSVVG